MSLYCKIQKRLGAFRLDVELEAGNEVLAVLGASGCGKSMTLRCIAGIERPDTGRIVLDGRVLFDSEKSINLPPQKRKAGVLFQDYALFPNMTVLQNIAAAAPKNTDVLREKWISPFHLSGLENHYPHQLSGGQRQRCALARMLASEPDIIMLDEPFSALDTFLRWQMEQEIAAAIARFGKTVLLVSHNRDEVYRLSAKTTILHAGRNEPVRTKQDLYFRPQTYADALLTGCKNIFPAEVNGNRVLLSDFGTSLPVPYGASDICYVGIRAKKIHSAHRKKTSSDTVDLPYRICGVTENVFSYILQVQPNGAQNYLYWELGKDEYEELRFHPPVLSLPTEEIMFLRK